MNNNIKLLNSQKTVFTKNDIQKILNFNTKKTLDTFVYRAKKD
jgi:hypothetical protein